MIHTRHTDVEGWEWSRFPKAEGRLWMLSLVRSVTRFTLLDTPSRSTTRVYVILQVAFTGASRMAICNGLEVRAQCFLCYWVHFQRLSSYEPVEQVLHALSLRHLLVHARWEVPAPTHNSPPNEFPLPHPSSLIPHPSSIPPPSYTP